MKTKIESNPKPKLLATRLIESQPNLLKESNPNIFAITENYTSKYEFKNKGPKFLDSGKIVRYSILGKPEWFQKIQNPQLNIENIDSSKPNSLHLSQIPNKPIIKRPMSSIPSTERKEKKNEIILTKDEVLKEIGIVEKRLGIFKENTKRIPFSARIFKEKNNKCLNYYEQINEIWSKQSRIFSAKVHRNINDVSIYEKSNCFRQKVEVGEILNEIQTDHERYGDKYWEKRLRTSDFRPLSAKIETIRKPNINYKDIPFTSFGSDKYFKKKMNDFEQKFEFLVPGEQNLMVIGQKKSDLEIDAIVTEIDKNQKYFKKIIKKGNNVGLDMNEIEETIKADYDIKQLIKATGTHLNFLKPPKKKQ